MAWRADLYDMLGYDPSDSPVEMFSGDNQREVVNWAVRHTSPRYGAVFYQEHQTVGTRPEAMAGKVIGWGCQIRTYLPLPGGQERPRPTPLPAADDTRWSRY